MSATVTLHVYSGLPDPSWELTPNQVAELKTLVSGIKATGLVKPPGLLGRLGYRGLSVETVWEPGLEPTLYVSAGVIDIGRFDLALVSGTAEIELFLLSTGSDLLGKELVDYVKSQIESVSAMELAQLILTQPPYNPGKWNNDPNICRRNNCYNYANDKITNTFAQPGKGSGAQGPYPPNCSGTGAAAERDGQVRIPSPSVTPKEGQIVALVVSSQPGFLDYHWYRRDSNGMWSHKPGGTPARNADNSGRLISSPETCDRGPYRIFCGYYNSRPSRTRIA